MAAGASFLPLPARAQSLEPRAYSPSPVGTSFLVSAYQYTSGQVVFDSSSPLTDVRADVNIANVAYGHVFGLLGHQSSAAVSLPYAWGTASGAVGDQSHEISRSGLADPAVRLSTLLLGGPALDARAFAAAAPTPSLGVSLIVVAPLGQYDDTRLVNISSHRWAYQPQVGVSVPAGPWEADLYGAVWLYRANNDFRGGTQRTQDAIYSYQAHVSYTFRPRLWLAADATYYSGGTVRVNGVPANGLQNNSRVGVTLSLPVARAHSLKFYWSDGVQTRVGGEFWTVGIAWQHVWAD